MPHITVAGYVPHLAANNPRRHRSGHHTYVHTYNHAVETNWDPAKARTNVTRHGVAFEDAELALTDPAGLTREDPDARGEARFVTVGADALGRIVAVVYAYRGDDVRLISARPATRREKETYAQGI